jgi:hypothetical protein
VGREAEERDAGDGGACAVGFYEWILRGEGLGKAETSFRVVGC